MNDIHANRASALALLGGGILQYLVTAGGMEKSFALHLIEIAQSRVETSDQVMKIAFDSMHQAIENI